MATSDHPWKTWHKISFRFLFPFLGLTSYLCWDATIYIVHAAFYKTQFDLGKLYAPLASLLYWLDKVIYHTGFNPKTQQGYPGDNHYGVVFYLTVFFLSVIIAIIWSVFDKKRNGYNKLYYWFSLYLRYALAIVMFGYGIDKLIPVQMMHPGVLAMTMPYGQFNRFAVLWNFMGMSPGYMIFTGACELVASLLLFSRRTMVFGYVMIIGILANVVALNMFYNITVKLFSSQLLLYALFLLAPYAKNIFQFFFKGGTTAFSQKRFVFQTRRKKYLMRGVLIGVPLVLIVIISAGTYNRYIRKTADARREKIYNVTAFVAKDTLSQFMEDSVRWKRLLMNVFNNHVVVFTKDDKLDWYEYDVDSIKKTFTFHDNPDKRTWKTFSYTCPSNDRLQLAGKWKGRNVEISMKIWPVDSIQLNQEKVKLVGD